ncbi:ras association domain-containing protein 4-like [Actinia tenebrosa]|uniref:Ras association domain-containing protein 4-like n=1 Tax=Actinia tenebrosa TaxID=6105 RepID=A0A6P8ICQ1_ACTTE|nr:ras association domain-containing protein 4-like [Actinia tenebrosa]
MLDILRAVKSFLQPNTTHSKMPSMYHEHCTKPGPKSNEYVPPPEARIFKSRSAPNSPCFERKPLFPRSPRLSRSPKLTRSSTLQATCKRQSEKLRENKIPRNHVHSATNHRVGRSKSFSSKTEQKNSLGKVWHPSCLRCEECGKRLNPGQHSEHRGIPYCNIPCYSFLFGPGGYGHGGTESHKYYDEEKFPRAGLEAIRNDIFPRLRAYNTYFENRKALQLSCREVNGQFVLEGVLRVYWGLKNPVVLATHTSAADWKRKRSIADSNYVNRKKQAILKEMKENDLRPRTSTLERILARRKSITNKHTSDGTNVQKRPTSPQTTFSVSPRKEVVSYPDPINFNGNRWLNELYSSSQDFPQSKTTFTPPYGTSTNLRLTSKTKVPEVIKLLFAKFQITNNPKKFNLYAVYDNGSTRNLEENESPLQCRLMLGPSEYAAKLYIMEASDSNNVSPEVAQYLHFADPVLYVFLTKFKEEEEREVLRIKEWYSQYKKKLQELLSEISTAV